MWRGCVPQSDVMAPRDGTCRRRWVSPDSDTKSSAKSVFTLKPPPSCAPLRTALAIFSRPTDVPLQCPPITNDMSLIQGDFQRVSNRAASEETRSYVQLLRLAIGQQCAHVSDLQGPSEAARTFRSLRLPSDERWPLVSLSSNLVA